MTKKLPDFLRKAYKQSSKAGWSWDYQQGSKHVRVFDPNGVPVTNVSLTAFDGPLTKKVRSQLRRAGCPGL